jgi:hypothetical protein
MTTAHQLFRIQWTPTDSVEARAPDIVAALDAVGIAYPCLLRAGEGDGAPLVWSGDSSAYVLKCLFCALQNPEHREKSLLVAMQEHQAEVHGLALEVLHTSISVAREVPDRLGVTVFIWTLAKEVVARLALAQRCYLQATRYSRQALDRQAAIARSDVLSLVYTHPSGGPVGQRKVVVERQDDLAWYGSP